MKVFTFETAITRRFKFSSGTMHRHRGGGGGVYRVLVGRPEGKRPLGRHGCRWEDNFKLDLRDIGINGANWIQLAQDRVQWWAFVNMLLNLQVS
jgi:hypothetical protein